MRPNIKFEIDKQYCFKFSHYAPPRIVTIARITPKGFLIDTEGVKYSPTGVKRDTYSFRNISLQEITQEIRNEIERRELTDYLQSYRFDNKKISVKVLRKVAGLLKEEQAFREVQEKVTIDAV